MSYKKWLNFMSDIGLEKAVHYDYKDKEINTQREIERMLNRSVTMFQWHGLPETVPQEQLELMLQTQGYAIIGRIGENLYACYGWLGGLYDEYHRPTKATVAVPYLDFNAVWDIGRDCVVMRNDLMEQGLLPMFAKYAAFLTETDISMMMALVNLRVQAYISASDSNAIKSAQEMIDNLYNGELSVIADDMMLQSLKINVVNYSQDLGNIRETQQYIRGQLFNEIGLATNYNLKKERVTQAEVELNTDGLYPLIDNMLLRRRDGIRECERLFGVSWGVEFNSSWDYRVYNGEQIVTGGANFETVPDDTVGGSDSDSSESVKADSEGNDSRVESENGKTPETDTDNFPDISVDDSGDSGTDTADGTELLNRLIEVLENENKDS